MNDMIKNIYCVLCFLYVVQSEAVLPHVAKLAALRNKTHHLVDVITKNEYPNKMPVRKIAIDFFGPRSKDAPEEIKRNQNLGLMHISDGGRKAHIIINHKLKNEPEAEQVYTIFHEIAHAYDPHLERVLKMYKKMSLSNSFPTKDIFCWYPHVKEDARACIIKYKELGNIRAGIQVLSYEWHADWQAIQWMKKYTPEDAEYLKKWYAYLIHQNYQDEEIAYPPSEEILKWLKE